MTTEKEILEKIKEILPKKLDDEGLKQIEVYVDYQPYFVPEFPSFKTTPLVAVYRIRDYPDQIGWIREDSIDFYYYIDKPSNNIDELSKYEKIIYEIVNKNCLDLEIENILFPNYVDKGNFFLIGFQIQTAKKIMNI